MKIFKLFMVLDMLKSNLLDYLYAREQEEKYIFIFFKLLKVRGYFFLYTIMPHAWSCSNQSSTNKIVCYPCTSKRRKFKHFVAKHLS